MKKVVALILALVLVVTCFAGCSNNTEEVKYTPSSYNWGNNNPRYANSEYYYLMGQVSASADQAQRYALMHKAQDILMDEMPVIPLYDNENKVMLKKEYQDGFFYTATANKFFSYTKNREGGLQVFCASSPKTIDPQGNASVDGSIMLLHMYEGINKYVNDGNGVGTIVLGQAKSIDVSTDGLVYDITLRDDLKWSNGEKILASDFVDSWVRGANTDNAFDYAYMFDYFRKADGSLNVSYDNAKGTIKIILNTPTAFFMEILAFPTYLPVYKAKEKGDDQAWSTKAASTITNGPYVMTNDYATDSVAKLKMKKSDTYYNKSEITQGAIDFNFTSEATTAYANFKKGDWQYIDVVPANEQEAAIKEFPGEFLVQPYAGNYYLQVNVENPKMQDKYLRQALSMSIDRTHITKNIVKKGAVSKGYVVAGMIEPDGVTDFANVTIYIEPTSQLDKAKALLKEHGYTWNKENQLVRPDGQIQTIDLTTNPDGDNKATFEYLQKAFTDLGCVVNLSFEEWGSYQTTRIEGKFDVTRGGWGADYLDPMNFLYDTLNLPVKN